MPAIIATDRALGVVDRQLVTDAGGAPCCCGGSGCCALDLPCQPFGIQTCVGNRLTRATCPSVTSYRFVISTEYRLDLTRRYQISRPPTRFGEPPRITVIVRRVQIAFTASYSKCYVPGDTLEPMPGDPATITGVQLESVTENGASAFEYFAGGDVRGSSTEAFEILNQSGTTYGPSYVDAFAQLFGAVPASPRVRFGFDPLPMDSALIAITGGEGATCSSSFAYPNLGNSGRWAFDDQCAGGSLEFASSQSFVNGPTSRTMETAYRTTWRREYCPCGPGGGSTPQGRGGGCAGCGDASSLEVIA